MMGWVTWGRKSSEPFSAGSGTLGIDLNATRVRAMTGDASRQRALMLDEPSEELALAVSLEQRTPEVGYPARAIERLTPHLGCFDFLADIGQPRRWEAGRHHLTADDLLTLVMNRVRSTCPKPDSLTLTLPVYLKATKVTALAHLM